MTGPLTRPARKFLDEAVEIQLDRGSAKDAAFLARQFIQATLPHRDPKATTWTRKNGNFALGLQAGFNHLTGESYGLPFGVIPRLLLFWITTEALRTKERRLELGESLAHFMREVGLSPDTGGGKRGDAKRLQEQMRRLFQAHISFLQEVQEQGATGEAWLDMKIAPRGILWWDVKNPEQGTLWKSWIELGETFFEAITSSPIPVDTRALKALKRSPLALDLYALCCYESYRAEKNGKARFIPWRALMTQLGAEYEGERAAHDFAVKCRKALRKVQQVMPSLHLGNESGGILILSSSTTAIPQQEIELSTVKRSPSNVTI
jgi:hypothetical protein